MEGVSGLTVISSHTVNVYPIKKGITSAEVSLCSANCGVSVLTGTVLSVNQSVTDNTWLCKYLIPSMLSVN